MLCVDCGKNESMSSSRICEKCFDIQNERLKFRVRDVETYDEDRKLFLMRKSKELGLNYSAYDIRSMISAGMTDSLILKTEKQSVWTYGSEVSRAIPFSINDVSL